MGDNGWVGRSLRTAAWAPILVVMAYALALVTLGPTRRSGSTASLTQPAASR